MSELSHALAGAKPSRHDPARVTRAPSFTELVYAHYDWWRDRGAQENGSAGPTRGARPVPGASRRVVSAYWCSHVESGAALTEKKRALPWATPVCTFHRESDWATKHTPDIARELHRCDELAIRARVVLKGVRQSICLRLVMASTAHLLSLVDARAAHADEASIKAALEQEREALRKANDYYNAGGERPGADRLLRRDGRRGGRDLGRGRPLPRVRRMGSRGRRARSRARRAQSSASCSGSTTATSTSSTTSAGRTRSSSAAFAR